MQRAIDSEQALWITTLLGLIYRARFQRHRYGVCLVNAGIVELAIDQDCDRNQCPLAAAAELQNSDGARTLPFLSLLGFRRLIFGKAVARTFKLRFVALRLTSWRGCREKNQNDDG